VSGTMDNLYHQTILYLDLELTCWDRVPPYGMQNEIIEIGIVEMDLSTLKIVRERAHFVRPRRWEISAKCTDLTGITTDDIRTAKPLQEVLESIESEFKPTSKFCYAWGDDFSTIARKCNAGGANNPFRRCGDLSRSLQLMLGAKDQLSLKLALQVVGMTFDGVPHGALPDARNLALLHGALLRRLRGLPEPTSTTPTEPIPPPASEFAQKLLQCLK
jgi:inhibitor of KinA sporulation pathway (predicted exonuclease)